MVHGSWRLRRLCRHHAQAACRTLAVLPALSLVEFCFGGAHTLYDFGAVLQIIEAREAWQGKTRGGRRLEVQWSVELGNTCAQLADGSPTQRLRAVRFVVAPIGA